MKGTLVSLINILVISLYCSNTMLPSGQLVDYIRNRRGNNS